MKVTKSIEEYFEPGELLLGNRNEVIYKYGLSKIFKIMKHLSMYQSERLIEKLSISENITFTVYLVFSNVYALLKMDQLSDHNKKSFMLI